MYGGDPVRAAGLIVYRKASQQVQYLLMQTSYGSHHWTPPKGHVDPGEDDMTTSLRETEEEAGLNPKEHIELDESFRRELHYVVKRRPKVVVYWLAKLREPYGENNDPVRMSDEHQDYRWLPLAQATELSGFKDFADLLKECESYVQGKR